jgi:hypothetical protein
MATIVTEISTLKLVLTPARYENHQFVTYSNENLDDIANASSDYEIEMKVGKKFAVTTDLDTDTAVKRLVYALSIYRKNRSDFSIYIEPKASFTL